MPDNPQAGSAQEFRLPGHDLLSIAGRDATAFAQAQFMNEVAALPVGHWQWNGWLTPKGRVIALFALLKRDAETLWLLLPDTDATDLAAKLQRYVFRSKLVLAARDDLHANGRFAAPAQASGATFAVDGDALELDFGGDGGPRTMRISPSAANADAASAARWRRFDLQHGLPRLRDDQIEAWTPQQLSLQRLRAFSVKKGCYPGQEIVARTHFLGQAKRGLALLDATPAPAAGSDVVAGGRGIGTVVSAAAGACLAVLPLEREPGPLQADGIALHHRPLLGGLAR